MSALKKKEKEPSLFGVWFSGLSVAVLGAFCGFLSLASFPAKLFSSVADRDAFRESIASRAPIPGDVGFFEGPQAQGNSWLQKRTQLLGGEAGTVSLTAGELNAWVRNRFSAGAVEKEEDASVLLVPQLPNFQIMDGRLYMNLPVEGRFYGNDGDFSVHAVGRFGAGSSPDFRLEGFFVNSAAVPTTGGIAANVMDVFMKAYTGSEEFADLRKAWARVESVEVAEGEIRLELR